ncbi:hypothetical protein LSAT2_017680 [Lamellibrachia satsuma]|nr:hypothetical protein LSAT2_017680 [Lamellibrachia satsuma]
MEDECRCVPEPEVDNEPRGEYDAQRMLEAQEQRDRAAMPEQPIAIDEVRYDTNTTQMEPQAQPVTARPTENGAPLIPPMDMQSAAAVPKGKCYIPGNPVFSCARDVPMEQMPMPMPDEWFQGYSQRSVHPMYRTTSSDYGARTPTVHTMPTKFYPMSQEFSGHLGKCGMYRNHSLNCELDKNIVPDH